MEGRGTVRRHNGDYGKRDSEKARRSVIRGTVVVHTKEPSTVPGNGHHHPRRVREIEQERLEYVQWVFERRLRCVIVSMPALEEQLKIERGRNRPFQLGLSEAFVSAFKEHISKCEMEYEKVRVVARGVFPTNKAAGTFLLVALGSRKFPIPSKLVPSSTVRK